MEDDEGHSKTHMACAMSAMSTPPARKPIFRHGNADSHAQAVLIEKKLWDAPDLASCTD